jgi:hypothetical protein
MFIINRGEVPGLLEINATQVAQIQHAVGLRALHPAPLKELWAFCARISVPFPGIHPDVRDPLFIDPDIFNEYADYLTFAAKYDCAFARELRLGAKFLTDRNMAPIVMGQWLPDPDGSGFFQFTSHRPSSPPYVRGVSYVPDNAAYRHIFGRPGVIKSVPPTDRQTAARNALRHPALLNRPGFASDPSSHFSSPSNR